MNIWSVKTLELVTKKNYLDQLQEVYTHEDGERAVDDTVIQDIRRAFVKNDRTALINKLLTLEKFPYKDSYVAFLRKDRTAIVRNPATVKRICDRLYAMGIENVIDGVKQSKEANTRRGGQFIHWIRENFTIVELDEFANSKSGIVILGGNELDARNFCNSNLGIAVSKRPDIVAKVGKKYVVGEAKFLSATGGNQGTGFEDGIKLASNSYGTAHKIFVLDGIHWIETGSAPYKRIESTQAAILSILLLKDYFNSLL
jgi:hypothetical protein